jgi:Domain of unknown function (DUF4268)
MYTKEHASKITQDFWTKFGKYMAPVPSAEGQRANWVNYKTGIADLSFKMDVKRFEASIAIEIYHKRPEYAQRIFHQFELLKTIITKGFGETWLWEKDIENEQHQRLSSISISQGGCDIFNHAQWPLIISFLKPRIILLDEFWCSHKMIFEMIE